MVDIRGKANYQCGLIAHFLGLFKLAISKNVVSALYDKHLSRKPKALRFH